jgi:phosphomannomutase
MNAHWQALLAAARAFRDDDPDPATRAEADALIASASAAADGGATRAELEERFGSELTFGTAGLRGLIGAGTSRMNRRVVAQTTAGLCAYLLRQDRDAQQRGICLGYDGRHQSRAFAQEVAAVAWGAGFVVHLFDDVVPTPLVAFAVLDRAAVSGIVVTASHNPAQYNGYKVYLADGAQLGSPADREVERERAKVRSVLALPRRTRAEAQAARLAPSVSGISERYVAKVAAAIARGGSGPAAPTEASGSGTAASPLPVRAAYTALHGVGEPLARRVFAAIGAADVHSVREQASPDPDFPTVAFPNPEEPGALDLVLALGERVGADLAIANDPDADRLALAARVRAPQHPASAPALDRAGIAASVGPLAALSGNEVGVLLADHLLSLAPRDGKNIVVSTIVSTPLLERVVREHGAHCVRTLTGFKWIIGKALALSRERGLRTVLGFEEALGYCIGDLVHDKDGIAAAAHALHMAELHARAGRTLHDALELLYRRHGLCQSSQVSFTRPGSSGLSEIRNAMAKLRANPPRDLAGLAVTASLDLATPPEARPAVPPGVLFDASELPTSDVVALQLEGEHRITVRPSGTEPKLKLYLDVWIKLENTPELIAGREQARELASRLAAATATQLGF